MARENTREDEPRLYVRGKHLSYKRSRKIQKPSVSLLRIEHVGTRKATEFYMGKRVAYIYETPKKSKDDKGKIKVVWGEITKPHGNSGVVQARFRTNLPPQSFGDYVRIMLYPSNI